MKVHKRLVESKVLAQITKEAAAYRADLNFRTRPWFDDGQRVLPTTGIMAAQDKWHEFRDTFQALTRTFLDSYPSAVRSANYELGSLFNQEDYPGVSVVGSKFAADFRIMPIPTGGDFRANLSDLEVERIRAKIDADVAAVFRASQVDIWRRLWTVVKPIPQRLRDYDGGKEGAFRDTLITNVRDLLAVLSDLNIEGDPDLENVAKLLAAATSVDPKTLRENEIARNQVADDAEAILSRISAFMA